MCQFAVPSSLSAHHRGGPVRDDIASVCKPPFSVAGGHGAQALAAGMRHVYAPAMVRIIGLDPGLRNTGWGIIEVEGSRLIYVADGAVHSDADAPLAERLLQIHSQVLEVLRSFTPDEAAIEETFVNSDARATLKLGQARGAVMLAPATCRIPVAEYAPNQIKKSVVGAGHAEKQQVKHMVKVLLPRAALQTPDSIDALAIAICHAHHRSSSTLKAALARS